MGRFNNPPLAKRGPYHSGIRDNKIGFLAEAAPSRDWSIDSLLLQEKNKIRPTVTFRVNSARFGMK